MTRVTCILAQVGDFGGPPAAPAPIAGGPIGGPYSVPGDLWLPVVILLGIALYWLWLRRSVPHIRCRRDVVRAVAIHLLAAGILNVAVAWTGALLHTGITRNGLAVPWTGLGPNPHSPPQVARFQAAHGLGYASFIEIFDDGQFMHEHVSVRSGFPLPAMSGVWHDPNASLPSATYVMMPLSLTATMARGARIPMQPMWIGFAVNTVFYTAVLGLPLLRFRLLSQYRQQRGECTRCGYDLSGLGGGVCPECGNGRSA